MKTKFSPNMAAANLNPPANQGNGGTYSQIQQIQEQLRSLSSKLENIEKPLAQIQKRMNQNKD